LLIAVGDYGLCVSIEIQSFFFGEILGVDGGIVSIKGGNLMQFNNEVVAFIGYTVLAVYYLIHILKH
jgi:hypothetical protein